MRDDLRDDDRASRSARPAGARVRGVIFDLNGTLVDDTGLHFAAWRELGRSLGIALDDATLQSFNGLKNEDIPRYPASLRHVSPRPTRRLTSRGTALPARPPRAACP